MTGSVGIAGDAGVGLDRGLPSETDLVFARMAIVDVLKRGSKEISAPWENPCERRARHRHADRQRLRQGRRAPAATSWRATCAGRAPETWLQGEACRAKQGRLGGQEPAALVAVLTARSLKLVAVERDQAPHIDWTEAGPAADSRGRTNFFGVARMRDPYEILGVQKNATPAAVKSAFRRLAKKLHPDANKTDKTAATKFSELNAAYEIVGDEAKRKAFDRGEIDAEGKPRFQGFPAAAAARPLGAAAAVRARSGQPLRNASPGARTASSAAAGGGARGGFGGGGIDDILKEMFGGAAGGGGGGAHAVRAGGFRRRGGGPRRHRHRHHHAAGGC